MSVSDIYNRLPTIEAAEEAFSSREKIMDAVRVLLGTYGNEFGLCLVHAHCLLVEGEIMLSRGNVSEPEPVTGLGEYFPERWLASGEPYEFTTRPTSSPPAALFAAFKEIVGDSGVLGLYHVEQERDGMWIEHTEGRKNILSLCTDADIVAPGTTRTVTAWDFGSFDPVTLACNKITVCNSTTTRSGTTSHKNTQSKVHATTSPGSDDSDDDDDDGIHV